MAPILNLNNLPTDYVDEIYELMVDSIKNDALTAPIHELGSIGPPPMNTMLEKEDREVAIQKHIARKEMITDEVPPTNPGNILSSCCQSLSSTWVNYVAWPNNLRICKRSIPMYPSTMLL